MTMPELARILKHWDDITTEEKLFVGWALRHSGGMVPKKVMQMRNLYTPAVRALFREMEAAGVDPMDLRPAIGG